MRLTQGYTFSINDNIDTMSQHVKDFTQKVRKNKTVSSFYNYVLGKMFKLLLKKYEMLKESKTLPAGVSNQDAFFKMYSDESLNYAKRYITFYDVCRTYRFIIYSGLPLSSTSDNLFIARIRNECETNKYLTDAHNFFFNRLEKDLSTLGINFAQ